MKTVVFVGSSSFKVKIKREAKANYSMSKQFILTVSYVQDQEHTPNSGN